jgi:hypothetical protein
LSRAEHQGLFAKLLDDTRRPADDKKVIRIHDRNGTAQPVTQSFYAGSIESAHGAKAIAGRTMAVHDFRSSGDERECFDLGPRSCNRPGGHFSDAISGNHQPIGTYLSNASMNCQGLCDAKDLADDIAVQRCIVGRHC